VSDALGEVAVVGEQDQALGVGVEAADVEEPFRSVGHEVGQRTAPLRVRHRRDHPAGLVEGQVDVRAHGREPLAVDADDRRGGVHLGAEPGDHLAVDLHQPRQHQLLALAAAGDP
jgi:hypothetical protein